MKKSVFNSVIKDLGPILWRNIFSLVVVIIGGLSLILIALGDLRDGIFLAVVILINIIIGIIQEIRSKITLEKLQITTASKYSILRDHKKHIVYSEEIKSKDIVELRLGDQVPVDGIITDSQMCECNEALLSGESNNISKRVGDTLLAGSIIVAGSAKLVARKPKSESYIAVMTQNLKRYQRNLSPIQKSMLKFIQIMAMALVVIALVILAKSYIQSEPLVIAIKQIAAIAATIIAEGLILTSTIFFTYGAIRMSRKKVLLQQINAIENLGRVSIVCLDKTGTLTQNQPIFDKIEYYSSDPVEISNTKKLITSYIYKESAITAVIQALRNEFKRSSTFKIINFVPFSSERKYAAFEHVGSDKKVFVGASEYFTPNLDEHQKKWAEDKIKLYSKQAKRVLMIATAISGELDDPKSLKGLEINGLIIMDNPLKESSKEVVRFLQKRGLQLLVISGDNSKTVRAIADRANIAHDNRVISGSQVEAMTKTELIQAIKKQPLFARILPSQKERIVKAAQTMGLTAMVGDGANDALAIKTADVGVAMFSGSSASRQTADIVLLDNSFATIPKGIGLSDSIITTLEMVASLFFSRVWTGVFLIFGTLLMDINYPFTPRNITLLNLFIIGFPVVLWGAWPRNRIRSIHDKSFLARTLPFSIVNALIIATTTLVTYYLGSIVLHTDLAQLSMIVYSVFVIMSIFTISLIPESIGVMKDRLQTAAIWFSFGVIALILMFFNSNIGIAQFFGLSPLSIRYIVFAASFAMLGAILQKIAVRIELSDKLMYKLKILLPKRNNTRTN
ncbi:MAG: cation-transporting P-type ATPase [Patescibacteria group bacterium]|jgi:cation-transporting ATPase E|nr:cation-transporting P-type ATPase [Patescibacteria group bacterium]